MTEFQCRVSSANPISHCHSAYPTYSLPRGTKPEILGVAETNGNLSRSIGGANADTGKREGAHGVRKRRDLRFPAVILTYSTVLYVDDKLLHVCGRPRLWSEYPGYDHLTFRFQVLRLPKKLPLQYYYSMLRNDTLQGY